MDIIDAVAADVGVVVGAHVTDCETGGCECAYGCCVGGGGVDGAVANEHDVSVIGGAAVDDGAALFGSAEDVEGDIHRVEGALACNRIIVVVDDV